MTLTSTFYLSGNARVPQNVCDHDFTFVHKHHISSSLTPSKCLCQKIPSKHFWDFRVITWKHHLVSACLIKETQTVETTICSPGLCLCLTLPVCTRAPGSAPDHQQIKHWPPATRKEKTLSEQTGPEFGQVGQGWLETLFCTMMYVSSSHQRWEGGWLQTYRGRRDSSESGVIWGGSRKRL